MHFRAPLLPDLELTRRVLAFMEGPEDVRLWLLDLDSRRVKPQGWGLYFTDAVTWPARRPDVQAQVEAERIASAQRDAESAKQFGSRSRSDETQQAAAPAVMAPPILVSPRCVKCEGAGIREATDDPRMYAWCECAEGVRKKADEPDAVDQANALVLRIRRQFETSREKAEPMKPRGQPHSSGCSERKGLARACNLIPAHVWARAED
ncbi:MAG TPA: hypothetical protein VGR73_01135 [Bryobacteraceae bacterium]|nr:hypothetical protein [Bryobacteraceae bacterium]